jgi:hypothetical protein
MRTTTIKVTGQEDVEILCKPWKGDDGHTHIGSEKYAGGKIGNTARKKLGSWNGIRPKNIYADNNNPVPEDKEIIYMAYWKCLHVSTLDNYSTQKHHVIPVKSMERVKDLANNLELLGFDINTEDNGIRLPMHDEDIFWHDLPRHFNWTSAHSEYNDNVRDDLKDKFKVWKSFCREELEGNLLIEIQKYIDDLRNKIIQWDHDYFVVVNGGKRNHSFTKAGYTVIPSIDKQRQYPKNINK